MQFLRKFYISLNAFWTPFERLLNAFERFFFWDQIRKKMYDI